MPRELIATPGVTLSQRDRPQAAQFFAKGADFGAIETGVMPTSSDVRRWVFIGNFWCNDDTPATDQYLFVGGAGLSGSQTAASPHIRVRITTAGRFLVQCATTNNTSTEATLTNFATFALRKWLRVIGMLNGGSGKILMGAPDEEPVEPSSYTQNAAGAGATAPPQANWRIGKAHGDLATQSCNEIWLAGPILFYEIDSGTDMPTVAELKAMFKLGERAPSKIRSLKRVGCWTFDRHVTRDLYGHKAQKEYNLIRQPMPVGWVR